MTKCTECKKEVVHYYRSLFCKECTKDFFEGDEDDKSSGEKRDKQSSLQG